MKKNLKIVSLAAAALFMTAPVFTTATSVNAASTTIQGPTDSVAMVYEIHGTDVAETNRTLEVNSPVNTFNTITIDGDSYTQIDSANSNYYVKSSWVNGSYNPETGDVESDSKMVMRTSIAYTGSGKKTGKRYLAFHNTTINYPKVKIGSATYYNVTNTNDYIKAVNIDGKKKTLKKNAYVYDQNGKRGKTATLTKGKSVTVYGSSLKIKGKSYYTIGEKRYVKVANF